MIRHKSDHPVHRPQSHKKEEPSQLRGTTSESERLLGTSSCITTVPSWQGLLVRIFLMASCLLAANIAPSRALGDPIGSGRSPSSLEKSTQHEIRYDCPPTLPSPSFSRNDDSYVKFYDEPSNKLLRAIQTNLTNYLKVYRKISFDSWTSTYEEFKLALKEWKILYFAPVFSNPQRNYKVYESASGIGLNLALTVEILNETMSSMYQSIELHGSDYVASSVQVAQILYQQGRLVQPYQSRMGQFCTASSTNLQHVPSNTFDLVFTGYITPLLDPLNIVPRLETKHDMNVAYHDICNNQHNHSNVALIQQMKQKQEEYYSKWVEEMIRIAQPGAPVIVESVSLPLCADLDDWGGVSREFWKSRMSQWPVQANSLDFGIDKMHTGRYHVYFRKGRENIFEGMQVGT